MVIPLKVGFSPELLVQPFKLNPISGCFGAGARGPGSLGLAPVVATASFPLINLPKFYLSFTILVSLILVKYPDRVGLVNVWYGMRTIPQRANEC